MRNGRPAHGLVYPLLLLAAVPGCQALHGYRPAPVLAQDAETKQPIAGAEVHISYPVGDPALAPWESSGPTGGDGIARLRAAPYGDGMTLEVTARGYLPELHDMPAEAVQALRPAGLFEAVGRRPPSFVVALYAEPRPTVELVLPPGFLGQVKVEVQARGDVAGTPGQRCFRYAVGPDGSVQVLGPPLLGQVRPPDFRVVYAGGAALSRNAKDSEPGFWWLKCEGGTHYFLVGMRSAYAAYRRATGADDTGGYRGGGGGGGRGRRGRGGRQPSPDVNPAMMTQ